MQNTKQLIASTLAALTIFASAAAPAVSDNPLLAKLSIVSTLDASAVSSNNYAVTTPSGLNIRKGADTSFKSVGTIPFAANFTVKSKTRKPDGLTNGFDAVTKLYNPHSILNFLFKN